MLLVWHGFCRNYQENEKNDGDKQRFIFDYPLIFGLSWKINTLIKIKLINLTTVIISTVHVNNSKQFHDIKTDCTESTENVSQ